MLYSGAKGTMTPNNRLQRTVGIKCQGTKLSAPPLIANVLNL